MREKPTWGIVTTLKEKQDVVLRFVAHHLAIGAHEIILFFDDPEDPSARLLGHLDRLTVHLCDSKHWKNGRPDAHQKRQKDNANRAYQSTQHDWLIHIDADEMIHNQADVGDLLMQVPYDQNVVRLPVAESFAGTQQGRNIFRFALPNTPRGRAVGEQVYGEAYPILDGGLLSHTAGKHFVRTGQSDFRMSIHGPYKDGVRDKGVLTDKMTLLHLHSYDEDEWVGSVARRLTRGAYQKKFNDNRKNAGVTAEGLGRNAYLTGIMETEGEDGLRAFHRRVCRFGRDKRPLRKMNALLKVNLWFDQKVANYFPEALDAPTKSFSYDATQGQFAAELEFRGSRMIVYPDSNYTEGQLARGVEAEPDELEYIQNLITGRKVVLYDVGANSGIYSLLVARHASEQSTIHAFEPNPTMMARLTQNIDLNQYSQINKHQVALGSEEGTARLFLHTNLGEASLLGNDDRSENINDTGPKAIDVALSTLKKYAEPRKADSVYILKIDIEGAEPICLVPFFDQADPVCWPDYILFEHAHANKWDRVPRDVVPAACLCFGKEIRQQYSAAACRVRVVIAISHLHDRDKRCLQTS